MTVPVAPGLVYLEDCHRKRAHYLVRETGEVVEVTRAQALVIRRDVAGWCARADLPAVAVAESLHRIQTAPSGWVARITGRDPKWGLERAFQDASEATPGRKTYSLPWGVYEVKGRLFGTAPREHLAVYPDGRVDPVTKAWVYEQLRAREAKAA